ncbi:GMC family oxidoreductase [Cupriavidus basilensis]
MTGLCTEPRGRGLGGSSAINGMVYIRGHQQDFDGWRDEGNSGWGYDDVLPYFKRMEHNARGEDAYRGVGGPLYISDPAVLHPSSAAFIEAAVRQGIARSPDLNGAIHDGVGYIQHNIRRGRRHSAYNAYLELVHRRQNLVVKPDCLVTRILLQERQACGVEVILNGEKTTFLCSREVIVSAGALNSPQLLMLSGDWSRQGATAPRHSGAPRRAWRRSEPAGPFLISTAAFRQPTIAPITLVWRARKYWEGIRYLATGGGYLALGSSQVAAFVKSSEVQPYADLQISFRPMTFTYHEGGRIEVDPAPAVAASVYRVRPAASGTVSIRSVDPTHPPVLTPNFLTHQEDIEAMISGIRKIRTIMATEPMASRICQEILPGPDAKTDDELMAFMQQHGNSAFIPRGLARWERTT